jgi:hypothetical protein
MLMRSAAMPWMKFRIFPGLALNWPLLPDAGDAFARWAALGTMTEINSSSIDLS